MNKITYKIETFWDHKAKVWVATSDDVFGLATEANNLEDLTEKLKEMIPELLMLNQQIPDKYKGKIYFEIISHRQDLIEVA